MFSLGKTTIYYHVRKKFGRKLKPLKMNLFNKEILGEFLGLFAGDGYFNFDEENYKYRIIFFLSINEKLILKRLRRILFVLFGKYPNVQLDDYNHLYRVVLYGKQIYPLLKEFLEWEGKRSQTIRLKKSSFSEKALLKGFIRGLINSDGSVYVKKSRLSFGSISKKMITQCSGILKSLEIEHKVYRSSSKNRKEFHFIVIEGVDKVKKFDRTIGLICSEKQKKIEKILRQ
jgi:hypothetical protein